MERDSLFSVGQMKEMRIQANAKNHAIFTRGDEPEPANDSAADSILQGSLATFLTEFFENGGPGGCWFGNKRICLTGFTSSDFFPTISLVLKSSHEKPAAESFHSICIDLPRFTLYLVPRPHLF